MCALIRILALASSVQLAAAAGGVRLVRKEAPAVFEKDLTAIGLTDATMAADPVASVGTADPVASVGNTTDTMKREATTSTDTDVSVDVDNSTDVMRNPADLDEMWISESRDGNGKWDTTLPGKALGNDDHTVFMIFQTPWSYSGKREWLLNIGQTTTGAHHWLWNGNSKSQMGVWNGGQVQEKLMPTGSKLSRWPVKTMSTVYTGGILTLYVNGRMKGSAAMKFDIKNGNVKVGKAALKGESDFSGIIRHVRIYRKALKSVEVRELHDDHV